MALSPDDIKARYPLPVYNYKVEINGEIIAFSEVSGLSKSFETSTYKESKTDQPGAGPEVMYMPGQMQPINITLKKGYVRTKNLPVFYNWINGTRINQTEKKDIMVRLTDEEGNAVVTWTVINAFPTKLDAPTFDANSNDVAIESLELMADNLIMEES
jgi:phage tail-like protein